MASSYRPPGRSNRSGRTGQSDNDVFEGLPVKQWGEQSSRVSLATPQQSEEAAKAEDSIWAEPPMPRDYQLLQPWTQHLLRLARSGKVGVKRKAEEEKGEDDAEDDGGTGTEDSGKKADALENRVFVAKKWKLVPEHALVPEHQHWEFLAKRRKGLPSMYGPADLGVSAPLPMRRTKVQKTDAGTGEVALYEVLVPEGQSLENEVSGESAELANVKPVVAAPGTVIEGVGIANDEGVVVAEHLIKPLVSERRRNKPPPKKKGGPGRGKKRVTFTNPDGSTYTTVVPNATKIVPQPGQTVKHVAKGEEASADQNARPQDAEEGAEGENAEQQVQGTQGDGEADGDGEGNGDEDDGSDEGEEGEDDDDREEGELSDEDGQHENATPAATPAKKPAASESSKPKSATPEASTSKQDGNDAEIVTREASSSPDLPLAHASHSRNNSLITPKTTADNSEAVVPDDADVTMDDAPAHEEAAPSAEEEEPEEEDLLGGLEQSLAAHPRSTRASAGPAEGN